MKSNRVFTAAAVAAGAAAAVWVLFVAERRLVADPPTAPTPDPTPVAYPRPAMAFGIGYVEPANEALVLATRAGGVVRTVHVTPGDRAAAGALLVELDDATWQAELAQAKADRCWPSPSRRRSGPASTRAGSRPPSGRWTGRPSGSDTPPPSPTGCGG